MAVKLKDPIKQKNKEFNLTIHHAAKKGHWNVVKLLVENGANVNYKIGDNDTPLHHACGQQNIEMVEYLCNNGADINSGVLTGGKTPLMVAASALNFDIVKFLISFGAKVELSNDEFNNCKYKGKHSALGYAVDAQFHKTNKVKYEIVSLLLKNGANENLDLSNFSYYRRTHENMTIKQVVHAGNDLELKELF